MRLYDDIFKDHKIQTLELQLLFMRGWGVQVFGNNEMAMWDFHGYGVRELNWMLSDDVAERLGELRFRGWRIGSQKLSSGEWVSQSLNKNGNEANWMTADYLRDE